jgi:transcriptional regulator with XRE-family HTH domain
MSFGKAVRRLRKKRRLSQEALADLASLHATFIGRIERGVQNVSLKTVQKLAKALKVKPDKLFR